MKGEFTMNMNEVINNVTLTKACSISPDKDSTEHKIINLRVKFDGAQLGDVFAKAVSSTVIAWQNGVGRKGFDTFKANQTVDIQFSAPASRPQMDPETAVVEMLKSMKPTEQVEFLKNLATKAAKV